LQLLSLAIGAKARQIILTNKSKHLVLSANQLKSKAKHQLVFSRDWFAFPKRTNQNSDWVTGIRVSCAYTLVLTKSKETALDFLCAV